MHKLTKYVYHYNAEFCDSHKKSTIKRSGLVILSFKIINKLSFDQFIEVISIPNYTAYVNNISFLHEIEEDVEE